MNNSITLSVPKHQQLLPQRSDLPVSSPLINEPPHLVSAAPSPGCLFSDNPLERELYRLYDLGLMGPAGILSSWPGPQVVQSSHFTALAARRLNEKLSPSSSETAASFLINMLHIDSMTMSEIQIVNDIEGVDPQWVAELYREASQHHPQADQIPSELFLAQLRKPSAKITLRTLFKYENPSFYPRKKDIVKLHQTFIAKIDQVDRELMRASFAVHPQKNDSFLEEGCYVHVLKPHTVDGQLKEFCVGNHFTDSAFGSTITMAIDPSSIELDDAGQVIETKLRVVVRCENFYRAFFEHAFKILHLSSTNCYNSNTPAEYLVQQMHGKTAFHTDLSSILGVHQLHDTRYWFNFEDSVGQDLRTRLLTDLPSDPVVPAALALMQELTARNLDLYWTSQTILAPAHEISRRLWKTLHDPDVPMHPLAEIKRRENLPADFLALPWILGGFFSLALRPPMRTEKESHLAFLVDHEQRPALQLRVQAHKEVYALFFIDLNKICSLLRMADSFGLLCRNQSEITDILLEECFKFIPEDCFSETSLIEINKFWLDGVDSRSIYKRSQRLLESNNSFLEFGGAALQFVLWLSNRHPMSTNVLINHTLRRLLISCNPKLQHAAWLMTKRVLRHPGLQKPVTPLTTLNEAGFYLLEAMKTAPDQVHMQSILQQTAPSCSSAMILRALGEAKFLMPFLDLYKWMSTFTPGQVFDLILSHELTENHPEFIALAAKTLMKRVDQISIARSLSVCYATLYFAMIRMADELKIDPKMYLTQDELTHLIEKRKTETNEEAKLRQKLRRILNPVALKTAAPAKSAAPKKESAQTEASADHSEVKETLAAARMPSKKVHIAARFIRHIVAALKLTEQPVVDGQEWALLSELFNQIDAEELILPAALLNDLLTNLHPKIPKDQSLYYLSSYVLLKQLIGRSQKKQDREHYVQLMLILLEAPSFDAHNASLLAKTLTLIPTVEIQTSLRLREALQRHLTHFVEVFKDDYQGLANLLTGMSFLQTLEKKSAQILYQIGLKLLSMSALDDAIPVVQALSRLQNKFDEKSCSKLVMPIMQALPIKGHPLAISWLKHLHTTPHKEDLMVIWTKVRDHLKPDQLTKAEIAPLIKMIATVLEKYELYESYPNFIRAKQIEFLIIEGFRTNLSLESIEKLVHLAIQNEFRSNVLLKSQIYLIQKEIKAKINLEENVNALLEIARNPANAFLNDLHEDLYLPVINDLLRIAKEDGDTSLLPLHPEYFDLAFKLLENLKMNNKAAFTERWKTTISLLSLVLKYIPEEYQPRIPLLKGQCRESKEILFDMRMKLCKRALNNNNLEYATRELSALFHEAKTLNNYRIDDIKKYLALILDKLFSFRIGKPVKSTSPESLNFLRALLQPETRSKLAVNTFAGLAARLFLERCESASCSTPLHYLNLLAPPFITSANIKDSSQLGRIRILFPVFLQQPYNRRHLPAIWNSLLEVFSVDALRELAVIPNAFENVSWNDLDIEKYVSLLIAKNNPNSEILQQFLKDSSFQKAISSRMQLNDLFRHLDNNANDLNEFWIQLIPFAVEGKTISNDNIKRLLDNRLDYRLSNTVVWAILEQAKTRTELRTSLALYLKEFLSNSPPEFQQEAIAAIEQWSILSLDEIDFLKGKDPLTLDDCLNPKKDISLNRFLNFLERNVKTFGEKEWERVLSYVSEPAYSAASTNKVLDIWNKTTLADTPTNELVKKPETAVLVGMELRAVLKCRKWGNFDWGIKYPDVFMEILSRQKVLTLPEISSFLKGLILNSLEREEFDILNSFLQSRIKIFLLKNDHDDLSAHLLFKAKEFKNKAIGKQAASYLFLCMAHTLPMAAKRTWNRNEAAPEIAEELLSSFYLWNQWACADLGAIPTNSYVYFLTHLILEELVRIRKKEPSLLEKFFPSADDLFTFFKALGALADKCDRMMSAPRATQQNIDIMLAAQNDLCVSFCNLLQIAIIRNQHRDILNKCALTASTLDSAIKEDNPITNAQAMEAARQTVAHAAEIIVANKHTDKIPLNLKEEIFFYLPQGFKNSQVVDYFFWESLDPKKELDIDTKTYWEGLFIPFIKYVLSAELSSLETFNSATQNSRQALETQLQKLPSAIKHAETASKVIESLNAMPQDLKTLTQKVLFHSKIPLQLSEDQLTAEAVVKTLKARAIEFYVEPIKQFINKELFNSNLNKIDVNVHLARACLEIYFIFDDLDECKKWVNTLQDKTSEIFTLTLLRSFTAMLKKSDSNKKNVKDLLLFLIDKAATLLNKKETNVLTVCKVMTALVKELTAQPQRNASFEHSLSSSGIFEKVKAASKKKGKLKSSEFLALSEAWKVLS